MNWLLVLPILLPLFTAILMLLVWRRTAWKRWLGVVGTAGLLIAGITLLMTVWQEGIFAIQVGNWAAPFGITLVADLLSALMVVLIGLVGVAAAIYALASVEEPQERFGFHPLLQILLMGLNGAVLTGDLFNLFVWFEVMMISSFVLISLGGQQEQIEGGMKYVTLNLFASAMFLTAAGIVYGVTGTLNMADLAVRFADPTLVAPGLVTTLAMFFLIAFGIKAAIFPLFFWLPASYHTTSVLVSAIFAGLLTKVGVYALIRVFTLLFVQEPGYTHQLLLVIAGITMVVGVLGAAAQNEIRRILSFHIVSQIGYMIMGLALLTPLALAGAIFFVAHNIIVKMNLFLIGGVVQRIQGSEQLKKIGGLYSAYPMVAALFLLSALALAGLPPLSGFWAKYLLVRAGLEIEQYAIVGVSLAVSLLTLFSMIKIWNEAFWKAPADPAYAPQPAALTAGQRWSLLTPIVLFTVLVIGMGLAVEPLMAVVQRAGEQLLSRTEYITAVLGAAPELPPVGAVGLAGGR